ncbi:transferase family hexapeptide repeat protein [Biostraticola tofi]|uniref:Transferase family hexapeptide repeat protein n=1 Tax=Biostraticola tofi TaxID=466109 RepID=A0A4R3Z4I2_9GAMM|nr:transferase family hexapeptide repeat protein [Biostraticola tofi]
MILKYLHPRFFVSFCRCLFLKLKYRRSLQLNLFRTYISSGVKIQIRNNGKITIKGSSNRVFISENTTIVSSGGHLEIGNGVFFNTNTNIVCHKYIYIGDNCLFGPNVCIYDSDHRYNDLNNLIRNQGYIKKETFIDNDTWVCAGCVITKGSIVGCHTVVGANTVVRGTLKSNSLYAGNPMKFLRTIE